ncbi:hypothetical protein TWF718_002365 [Orbilia javanica]|uniref:GPI inositol-deacylase winged helix domain-containing protein n=1 Tax=Orbilia javanica TaxID=47235 RepID=A0AAN8MHL5_9PEZI
MEVREMVEFFQELGNKAAETATTLRILFTSRYYPKITILHNLDLKLEDYTDHSQDIKTYIQGRLKLRGEAALVARTREEIFSRSSGVFLWVVLIVEILNKEHDRGNEDLRKKLDEVPVDIGKLFETILAQDGSEIEATQLCFRWVLFAARPLKRGELYSAVHFGLGNPSSKAGISGAPCMENYILSISKGLIELTKSDTAQFIHETVRDFLLGEHGKRYIYGASTKSSPGLGDEFCKYHCLKYLEAAQETLLNAFPSSDTEDLVTPGEMLLRCSGSSSSAVAGLGLTMVWQEHLGTQRMPFLEYALFNVFHHSNAARQAGISQVDFVERFPRHLWVQIRTLYELQGSRVPFCGGLGPRLRMSLRGTRHTNFGSSEPFYLQIVKEVLKVVVPLVSETMVPLIFVTKFVLIVEDLLQALAQSKIDTSLKLARFKDLFATSGGETALARGYKAVHTFLGCKCIGSPTEIPPVIQYVCNLSKAISLLVHSHKRSAIISNASLRYKGESISNIFFEEGLMYSEPNPRIGLFLTKLLTDVECTDREGLALLFRVAPRTRIGLEIARIMLQDVHKVGVNLKCMEAMKPLSYAAANGHAGIAGLLLGQPGTGTNDTNVQGQMPLIYATIRGVEGIIKYFINASSIEVSPKNYFHQTVLGWAAHIGGGGICKALLSMGGVNVNPQDTVHGKTPLMYTLQNLHLSIAEILLKRLGINLKATDKYGKTASDYALERFVVGVHVEKDGVKGYGCDVILFFFLLLFIPSFIPFLYFWAKGASSN